MLDSSTTPVYALSMGEALIDLVSEAPAHTFVAHLGGAVYNLARALAVQGVHSIYANPLSNDLFGRQLRAELVECNVKMAVSEPVVQPTSLAIVTVDQRGQAQYGFYRDGVADKAISQQQLETLSTKLLKPNANNWALTGCLALAPDFIETTLAWLSHCKGLGARIVVDVNLRPLVVTDSTAYRSAVLRSITFADVVKASDEDLQWLFNNQLAALDNLKMLLDTTNAQLLALTCGAQGAYLISRTQVNSGSSQALLVHGRDNAQIQVRDTVGAGDCFLAGLIANIAANQFQLNEAHLKEAISHAIASASLNVQQAGCQPPTSAQVAQWLSQNCIQTQVC